MSSRAVHIFFIRTIDLANQGVVSEIFHFCVNFSLTKLNRQEKRGFPGLGRFKLFSLPSAWKRFIDLKIGTCNIRVTFPSHRDLPSHQV